MEKRWIIKESGDTEIINRLSRELNINQDLANLLVQRGVTTYNEAKTFFRPSLQMLHDPFLMKDMDRAVERLEKAFLNNEKVLVYGDYDVDGTTAVSLMYTFIHSIYKDVDFYIPDRYSEGYGVSYKGIDFAQEHGFSVIIALDCGIKAIEKVKYAKEKGIDFIIGDHHRPGDELPDAAAVLDPKREDCHYPYKELSGCGVAFKLAQAYSAKNGVAFEDLEKYLDLVAVSIAADIVPVTGENRILAHFGLNTINTNPRAGIESILKYGKINREPVKGKKHVFNREITISDLVFLIGPRINAAGRIESGNNSVKLLVADKIEDSDAVADHINDFNNQRRNFDHIATEEALNMIATNDHLLNAKSTVVYNPEWHKGVVGIVASRLTENYYRPTIVLTRSNGLITGSARSVKDFDIYDAIDACSDLLEHFGGHKYAAGLSIKPENFDAFVQRFEAIVESTISDKQLIPEIEIDMELDLSSVNGKFYRVLRQFAPFGPGNMAPIFMSKDVVDTGYVRMVGKNHLKMNVIYPERSSMPIPAIAFQMGKHYLDISKSLPFNTCYHIEENEWNGNVTIQLNVKDIRL
ncbi:MAG: single-stranded-DNA-specific exonuclease RecJ [Bacteroidales bacterium]|nr:single-stranded-DNA-specific exonuclease RecJ [Bacteroidales bacterium]